MRNGETAIEHLLEIVVADDMSFAPIPQPTTTKLRLQ